MFATRCPVLSSPSILDNLHYQDRGFALNLPSSPPNPSKRDQKPPAQAITTSKRP